MTYLNLPTLEQIEKWQQRWKQAKQMTELRSEIYRTDKRIVLETTVHDLVSEVEVRAEADRSDKKTHFQSNQLPVEPNVSRLQTEGRQEKINEYTRSTVNELDDKLQFRDEQVRERRSQAIDCVVNAIVHDEELKLKDEVGAAITNLELELPWSDENKALVKFQTKNKALIPLSIRFLKSLREMRDNGLSDFAGGQDGYENLKTYLQDKYSLTFFNPNCYQSKDQLELLCRRVMAQDQMSSSPSLFKPRYPSILRSANVAMMMYLLESQVGDMTEEDKLSIVKEAVNISSFGLLKASLASFHNHEFKDGRLWVHMNMNALEKGDLDIIKTCMSILDNNQLLQNEALIYACYLGDENLVYQLIEVGANINAKGDFGQTPLMGASIKGHSAIVAKLISLGTELDVECTYGRTAIMNAVANSHGAVVGQLIKAGASIKATTYNVFGQSTLTIASYCGYEAIVQQLIKAGSDFNAKDRNGNTALTIASEQGHEAVVKLLIAAKPDVNVKNNDGNTALIRASEQGHEATVKFLISIGSDVPVENNDGNTALTLASEQGHVAVVEQLIKVISDVNAKNNNGDTALTLASKQGHEAVVSKLIKVANIDVDMKNKYGNTALILASKEGHEATVKLLITAKPDVNVKNNNGDTALTLASKQGDEAVVSKLIKVANIDVDMKNKYDNTALILASKEGHEAVVKLLITTGLDVNIDNNHLDTPLIIASCMGQEALVDILINAGADIDFQNADGDTALMWSCKNYPIVKAWCGVEIHAEHDDIAMIKAHRAVIEKLIVAGAKIDAQNSIGKTALMYASEYTQIALVERLIVAGADINLPDHHGYTALMYASLYGDEAVVAKLLGESDINIEIKNRYGNTALMIAESKARENIVEQFRQYQNENHLATRPCCSCQ